jgi:hypothetical protein
MFASNAGKEWQYSEPAVGWTRSGLQTANEAKSSREYYDLLADSLVEWEKQRLPSARHVFDALIEAYRMCLLLRTSKHIPIDDKEQEWLNDRCVTWAEHFQNDAIGLAQRRPEEETFRQMKEQIGVIVSSLRKRANDAG